MTVYERIKKRRKELGLSADVVADALGVSRSTIYRYESADIEKLPVDHLNNLATVLCTTPAYLMGWTDDPVDYDELAMSADYNMPEEWNGTFEEWVKAKDAADASAKEDHYKRQAPEPELPSFNLSDEELLIAMAYSRADTTTKNGVRALLELPFIPVDKEIEEEELPRLKAPDEYKTYYPIVDPNTGETRQIEIVTELDKLKHRNLVRLAEIGVIPKHPRVKRLRDIRKKEKV